jgi:hypothetical protein
MKTARKTISFCQSFLVQKGRDKKKTLLNSTSTIMSRVYPKAKQSIFNIIYAFKAYKS